MVIVLRELLHHVILYGDSSWCGWCFVGKAVLFFCLHPRTHVLLRCDITNDMHNEGTVRGCPDVIPRVDHHPFHSDTERNGTSNVVLRVRRTTHPTIGHDGRDPGALAPYDENALGASKIRQPNGSENR